MILNTPSIFSLLKLRISLVLVAALWSGTLWAQGPPKWIDAGYRAQKFSNREFLTGYSEQSDVAKKESAAMLENLVGIAKGSLIEKVEVEVNSVSTSQLSDANGEIDDFFSNTVKSSSSLKLAGLQVEKYYNPKEKKAYAFVYVDRFKLALYYSDIIDKHIETIESGVRQSKSEALKTNVRERYRLIADVLPLFAAISAAQRVLIAIGQSGEERLQATRVNKIRSTVGVALNAIQNYPDMTIDDLGFVLGYTLLKEVNDNNNTVSANKVTFEETGLSSDFSVRLLESMTQSLGISKTDSLDKKQYLITGDYWEKGDRLQVKYTLRQHHDGRVLAKSAGSIALSYLNERNVAYVPLDVMRVRQLPQMRIIPLNNNLAGKAGAGIEVPLQAEVRINGQPAAHIPILFYQANDSAVYCKSLSNDKGIATCKVNNISGKYLNQVIVASVNLQEYLSISHANMYYRNTVKNSTMPTGRFRVKITPSTVAFKVSETNFGQQAELLLIEPKIKQQLAAEGFVFADKEATADFIIFLDAASRQGGTVSGLYFAYVDVNVSVYDVSLGREIFKENFKNIKGGGGSFQQAGAKAYYRASDVVTREVVKALIVKN